jgi:hypothetical protein
MFLSVDRRLFSANTSVACVAISLLFAALPLGASALPITPSTGDADHAAAASTADPLKQLRDVVAARPQAVTGDDFTPEDSADLARRASSAAAAETTRSASAQGQAGPDIGPSLPYMDARGETLGQALRLIATVDRADPVRARRLAAARGDDDDADWIGLSGMVLDSETSAALLRKVIDIKSTDGNVTVFSVLGLGDFMLEVTPGDHGWTIAELSTGWSLPMSSGSDGMIRGADAGNAVSYSGDEDRNAEAGSHKSVGLFRLLRWLREFVSSPLGLLGGLMISLFALLWGAARTVVALERRSVGRRGY